MKRIIFSVRGKQIASTELCYSDLVFLVNQFINMHGYVPRLYDFTAKNKLPQPLYVKRILASEHITYSEFMCMFNQYEHNRSDISLYDYYKNKLIDISNISGKSFRTYELTNNKYGLPSANWFVKHCPCKSVKTYNDFLSWCGLPMNQTKYTKEFVSATLISLQNALGRPLTQKDITRDNVGFSIIVVKRLFGSLSSAKEELGLLPTAPSSKPTDHSVLRKSLEEVIADFKNQTGKEYITWAEIESGLYGSTTYNHKTYMASFEKHNESIGAFFVSNGISMECTGFSHKMTFDDGEVAMSHKEHCVSTLLRGYGYRYGIDYIRNYKYSCFTNTNHTTRMDCDYYFVQMKKCIEVAGIINSYEISQGKAWCDAQYTDRIHAEYQHKMIQKMKLLEESDTDYIFIFADDVLNGTYIDKITKFINADKAA